MEDIAVVNESDILHIIYSDNVYRGPTRGAFEVIKKLLGDLHIETDIHLILQEDQIPQVVLKLSGQVIRDYYAEKSSLKQLFSTIQISYDTDKEKSVFRNIKKQNRSAGKVDLVLYPQITLNNAWMDKIYGTILNIAPAIEIGLWQGASFTGQVIFPIWNNMKGEMDYIRAGMLVFRQEYRFPKNVFATVNIGNFNSSRIGVDVALKYRPNNDRWAIGLNAGLTGSSTFYSGQWEVTRWKRTSGSVFLTYNEPWYNLEFNIAAHRYIYGDYGVRLDCTRHFGEVSIGFYGMYSGGEPNGGFHFAIPLPTKKRMNRKVIRLGLPEYFDWEYEAQSGNEYAKKRLGRYYETRPDENRSQRYYNPHHMKETLIKLASEKN